MNDQQYMRLARTGAISTYMQTRRQRQQRPYHRRQKRRRILRALGLVSLLIATLYLIAIAPQP